MNSKNNRKKEKRKKTKCAIVDDKCLLSCVSIIVRYIKLTRKQSTKIMNFTIN